jgi:hypothetical protein
MGELPSTSKNGRRERERERERATQTLKPETLTIYGFIVVEDSILPDPSDPGRAIACLCRRKRRILLPASSEHLGARGNLPEFVCVSLLAIDPMRQNIYILS